MTLEDLDQAGEEARQRLWRASTRRAEGALNPVAAAQAWQEFGLRAATGLTKVGVPFHEAVHRIAEHFEQQAERGNG